MLYPYLELLLQEIISSPGIMMHGWVWEPELSSTLSFYRGGNTQRREVASSPGSSRQLEVELVPVPVLLIPQFSLLSISSLSPPKLLLCCGTMSAAASDKAPRPREGSVWPLGTGAFAMLEHLMVL